MTTIKRLDLKKWNERRVELEDSIVQLKTELNQPGRNRTSSEATVLAGLQLEATAMYMLRAEQRDKLHAVKVVEFCEDPLQPGSGVTVRVDIEVTRDMQRDFIAMFIDAGKFMREVEVKEYLPPMFSVPPIEVTAVPVPGIPEEPAANKS